MAKVLKAIQVEKWTADTAQDAAQAALTPEQRATNKHQADMLADRQKRTQATIDENKRKAALESTTRHKADIQNLMHQALAERAAKPLSSKGLTQDTIDDVSNTNYYQNHPIGQYRGEVLDALEKYRRYQAGTETAEDRAAAAREAKQLTDQLKLVPKGDSSSPAPPKTAAPATVTPPATAKTYTESQIRQDATRRGFKSDGPEADAAVKAARTKGLI